MAEWKVTRNLSAIRAIRTGAAAIAMVHAEAEKVAARAGDGFEALPMQAPRNRAHAIIVPVTWEAVRRNGRDNTLIRALGSG